MLCLYLTLLFFASGECPALEGATPIFVDVKVDTYNLDPEKLEVEIKRVISEGKYTPKVVVAVDLFGQPAEYDKIKVLCEKYNLLLLEDGAQGFGREINGKKACSFGDIATTSFFPAKPLGCYGDGGAIFTNNDEWATLMRSYAVHGKGSMKYDNVRIGLNSRLDTIQVAILKIKLKAFKEYELNYVNKIAEMYNEALKNTSLVLPVVPKGYRSSWAQYTIQLPQGVDRARIQTDLKKQGIPTMVYYPKPMHRQDAFDSTDYINADCKKTEELCKTVLSLPIHPYMEDETVAFICKSLILVLLND